jgi:glucose/mannose transport system substrate-binding protein
MVSLTIRTGLALGAFVALCGCSSSNNNNSNTSGDGNDAGNTGDGSSTTPSGTVQIYSWWVTGAEETALSALIADYQQQYPKIAIENAVGMNAAAARMQLSTAITNGQPPDTFQVTAGYPTLQYVVTNGTDASQSKLEALDFLAQQEGWATNMNSSVLASVSYGGHPYAVPVDVSRTNALFYNKAIFAKYNLQPPQTMADFATVAQTLQTNGVTPVAVGTGGGAWVLDMIFKGLLVTEGGAAYHTALFAGQNDYFSGKTTTPDATFTAAVNDFGTIMTNSNLTTMPQLTWDQAVDLVATSNAQQAAMTIMGDWAIAEFVAKGAVPGVDFGEVATPGSGSAFLFTSDAFVLPVGAPNRTGAVSLLTEWGSQRGQAAFNPLKGSIPARTDTDPSAYNAIAQQEIMDFKTLTVVPDMYLVVPSTFQTVLDNALQAFVTDGNVQNVVQAVKDNYALLQAGP